jgi:competence ComEA-like helix-hairpin-helix protein
LNLNNASPEELAKLYNMTPEVVAAIKDWKDGDSAASNGGAEAEYYGALQPPYLPRNGEFQTVRELLMVRGVTAEFFKGEDENQNGLLDPEEDDGNSAFPPDNRDSVLDAGWSGLLTVQSSSVNQTAAGQPRVNVQEASERDLTAVRGITPEIARAIIASRGQKELENLADLLDVTNRPPSGGVSVPAVKPIDEQKLMDIADDVCVKSDTEEPGLININTAPAEVLQCLPGLTKELAEAIVSYRQSAGFFPNIAWLLKVDGMTKDIFKQVSPRVSVRSDTFRILSEGRVRSTGARKRMEVVVRQTAIGFDTLAYREDL